MLPVSMLWLLKKCDILIEVKYGGPVYGYDLHLFDY